MKKETDETAFIAKVAIVLSTISITALIILDYLQWI